MSRSHRRFSFTIGCEFVNGELFESLPDRAAFVIWQAERAPTTNYEHYQGYIRLKNPCTFNTVKALFPTQVHLEVSKGTEQQNIDYCSKEESRISGPWQFGRPSMQGKRSDLDELVQAVIENKSNLEIASENPVGYSRFATHLKNLRVALTVPKRRPKLNVYVLVGLTGTGKSYWAWENFPDLYCPIVTKDRVWWDGYNQNPTILLDDYRGGINYPDLLRYLDVYPLTGEIKGGTVALNYVNVVITSNNHIGEWYPTLSHADLDPLRRRFTCGIYEIRSREDLSQINIIENQ